MGPSHIIVLIFDYIIQIGRCIGNKMLGLAQRYGIRFCNGTLTALKLNHRLLPRCCFEGLGLVTPVCRVLPVARTLCQNKDLIIIFATEQNSNRVEERDIKTIDKRFPAVVEYGRRQRDILSKLEQPIWLDYLIRQS
jgi:hypothetical protein